MRRFGSLILALRMPWRRRAGARHRVGPAGVRESPQERLDAAQERLKRTIPPPEEPAPPDPGR